MSDCSLAVFRSSAAALLFLLALCCRDAAKCVCCCVCVCAVLLSICLSLLLTVLLCRVPCLPVCLYVPYAVCAAVCLRRQHDYLPRSNKSTSSSPPGAGAHGRQRPAGRQRASLRDRPDRQTRPDGHKPRVLLLDPSARWRERSRLALNLAERETQRAWWQGGRVPGQDWHQVCLW